MHFYMSPAPGPLARRGVTGMLVLAKATAQAHGHAREKRDRLIKAYQARPAINLGVFPHSANYDAAYPGSTPENHPPTEACMINSKQPGVQNSRPWDPWLPVVENSQLFAQRGHSAGTAHGAPPLSRIVSVKEES